MRILVTGATGFIGRRLIPALLDAGHRVRVLLRPGVRNPRLPPGQPVEVALSRLDDRSGLQAALAHVDAVVHLATGAHRGPRLRPVGGDETLFVETHGQASVAGPHQLAAGPAGEEAGPSLAVEDRHDPARGGELLLQTLGEQTRADGILVATVEDLDHGPARPLHRPGRAQEGGDPEGLQGRHR